MDVSERRTEMRVRTSGPPSAVIVDPDGWLLEVVQPPGTGPD
jgi:hypothetical protein